jgi:hypothetical protein
MKLVNLRALLWPPNESSVEELSNKALFMFLPLMTSRVVTCRVQQTSDVRDEKPVGG